MATICEDLISLSMECGDLVSSDVLCCAKLTMLYLRSYYTSNTRRKRASKDPPCTSLRCLCLCRPSPQVQLIFNLTTHQQSQSTQTLAVGLARSE